MSIKMKVTHAGMTESGKLLEIGTEVEYIGHLLGGAVKVRLADGTEENVMAGCFDELKTKPVPKAKKHKITRKEEDFIMESLGLKKVRGAVSGKVYYE